jgi:hypothetical protein
MGYDFEREDGALWGTTSVGWRLLMHLAEGHGWRPSGTLPPEDDDPGRPWAGDYTGNTGQRVTSADAAGLAAGLRAALASPKFNELVISFGREFRGQLEAASTPSVTLATGDLPPDDWRRATEEFANFCGGGGFEVN